MSSSSKLSVLKPDVITNPILNNPYQEPDRHWQLDALTQRAVNTVLEGRRLSGAYLSVPKARRRGGQQQLGLQIEVHDRPPHTMINQLRDAVRDWRAKGWPGTTSATEHLLSHWHDSKQEPKPFFCQRDAIETIIWLHEAGQYVDPERWAQFDAILRDTNNTWNDGIARVASKMATGTGKTKLMQMVVSWIAVNSENAPHFLAITPGLTVKERLAELQPRRGSPYEQLVPRALQPKVWRVRMTVLNFQAFQKRDARQVASGIDRMTKTVKQLLDRGTAGNNLESEQAMLERLLGNHRNSCLTVLNDEAHHCYLPMTEGTQNREGVVADKQAALWFNALRALRDVGWLRQVYDFSATPMFMTKPSKDLPSELFPWIVSDYPLIEAVEAGLTKIPRVPVADNTGDDEPKYRNVYDNAEYRSISTDAKRRPPPLVRKLLRELHKHYVENERGLRWETPPVMIVVANNIANANELYRYLAGYHNGRRWVPGQFEVFSNIDEATREPKESPPTLLVHSNLDAADSASATEENRVADAAELHLVSAEGKSKLEKVTRVREIFNTVGRPNAPGSHIRCVISVSMLTEGWDAKNVTHIFGFRPFGTQLLCEQVVGRGLRRSNFVSRGQGQRLSPEVVNVFGVPFNFVPTEPRTNGDDPLPSYTVHPVHGREEYAMRLPLLYGYRYEPPQHRLELNPKLVKTFEVHRIQHPTESTVEGLIGAADKLRADGFSERHYILHLAQAVVEQFRVEPGERMLALMRSAVTAVEDWLRHKKVNYNPDRWADLGQPLNQHTIPQHIANACAKEREGSRIRPIWMRDMASSTDETSTAQVYFTTIISLRHEARRSHLNYAVCHSDPELQVAAALDADENVQAWVRNMGLDFQIPYLDEERGRWRYYEPDFVARLNTPDDTDPLYAVIEFKGKNRRDSTDTAHKARATTNLWCKAVNESSDPRCRGYFEYIFLTEPSRIASDLREEFIQLRKNYANHYQLGKDQQNV